MTYNRTESAKWAIESQKILGELQGGVDKALTESAGRGFPAAPGDTLAAILFATQSAKTKLTEANGKIYDDRRGVIFQEEEFDMKLIVQWAKLGMELYRSELLNALEVEQAQNLALRDKGLADVQRLTAEVEARQEAIIRGRAEAERQVIGYKTLLALAERETLESEVDLANAQLATATKKLEIIDSLYQVLAAEELVLAAERLRIAAEERVLTAKEDLASVRTSMVPYYEEKAAAKLSLADTVTAEMPDKIALENLGYDRAALKVATGEVDHGIRMAELELEVARQAYQRANVATDIARARSQTVVAGFNNTAHEEINALRQAAGLTNIDTRIANQLGHATIEYDNTLALTNHERENITAELLTILQNINSRATSEAGKVTASASTSRFTTSVNLLQRRIVEGTL
jgi:hypothetical protein